MKPAPLLNALQQQLMAGPAPRPPWRPCWPTKFGVGRYHYAGNFHPGVDLAYDNGSGDDMHILSPRMA